MPGSNNNNNAFNSQNNVRLVHGGEEYFRTMLTMIGQARESIHLQCYIYDDDETGQMVADALIEAAARKVSVFLLADGYASQVMSKKFIASLRESGIQFRFFESLFRSRNFYFGRRMHHKIFVVDACYAMVGGVNVSDHYNDLPGKRAWLDFALYVEGNIARDLCKLCWKSWYNFSSVFRTMPCKPPAGLPEAATGQSCLVRMRRNDWVRRKNEISYSYMEMFRNARSHITICCSYFLPGQIIRRLLAQASKRGVKIRIIIAGPSDVMVAKNAERWMYDWLLRNNIELYEYQASVLHAKVAVCDGEWATVGSYNINKISAYASIELNLDVRGSEFSTELENQLSSIITRDCVKITKETHLQKKNWRIQFVRWCSYQFIRMIFYISTFYYKQR